MPAAVPASTRTPSAPGEHQLRPMDGQALASLMSGHSTAFALAFSRKAEFF